MLKTLAALVTLATTAAPAAAQAVWDARDLGGGSFEYRLGNDGGAAIILACHIDGVNARLKFPDVLEATESATIRGAPGGQQNIAVAAVNDRVVRVASGRGRDTLLGLLGNTPNLYVRAGGQRASFEVFGSAPVVMECLRRQRPE